MQLFLDILLGSRETAVSTADKTLLSRSPHSSVGETDDKQDNELPSQPEEKSTTEKDSNQVGELVLEGSGWWWQFRKVSQEKSLSEKLMFEQRR